MPRAHGSPPNKANADDLFITKDDNRTSSPSFSKRQRRKRNARNQNYVYQRYFQRFTFAKAVIYLVVLVYLVVVCVSVVLELFLTEEDDDGNNADCANSTASSTNKNNPCSTVTSSLNHHRPLWLLFLTRQECSFGRRLLASVLLGGIIGWERREADRPAGIRTMSLVSLGSCLFSINSVFSFASGTMEWDASRVSAAIPSGVGFLGAGLIFKQAQQDRETGETSHVVHGLTTASSLWVSAAVGMACAGQLYFSACFTVAVMMALLRFGPRQIEHGDDDEDNDEDDGNDNEDDSDDNDDKDSDDNNSSGFPRGYLSTMTLNSRHRQSQDHDNDDETHHSQDEQTPLRRESLSQQSSSQRGQSVRLLRNSHRKSRASLGGIV